MKNKLVIQKTNSDCGLASVSMACDIPYEKVLEAFMGLELYGKHVKVRPYATNYKDVKAMLSQLGFIGELKRFKNWDDITQPSIIKVSGMSKRNWHWVVAIPCLQHKLVIYNPSYDLITYFNNPPLDEMYVDISNYEPYGSYIECKRANSL